MQKPDEGTYKHTMVYIAIYCTQYLLQNQIWQSAGKYVATCLDKTQPNQSGADSGFSDGGVHPDRESY